MSPGIFESTHADDLYGAWVQLLEMLVEEGEVRSPRNMPTRELLGMGVRVEFGLQNIIYHPVRNLNYKFMIAEFLWIMEGSESLEVIAQYNQKLRHFSDDGIKLAGAYGPRLIPQMLWIRSKLVEADTRQAVAMIWRPTPAPSKDIACTVALQFLRRDNVLNLIVTMRSSDAWLGLPYDFFVFSQIANVLSWELGCTVGWVQFNLGSSHLYETDLDAAKKILSSKQEGKTLESNPVTSTVPLRLFLTLHNPAYMVKGFGDQWDTYAEILATSTRRAYA